MRQNGDAVDLRDILTPSSLSIWSPNEGYERLSVDGSTPWTPAKGDVLRTGSPQQQHLAEAALALWHDNLDAAHEVFQKDESANGSLWHAILHQREGDFSNSRYWLARAGAHPVYDTLGRLAVNAVTSGDVEPVFSKVLQGGWDAQAFVDVVRQVSASNDAKSRSVAVELQRLEWKALFVHCARHAH